MWSSYVGRTATAVSRTHCITTTSFQLIQQIDEVINRISAIIDMKVEQLKALGQQDKSMIEDIRRLAKLIEELTEKKQQLGLKNYDLIDQNMKLVDFDLSTVRKVMNSQKSNLSTISIDEDNSVTQLEGKEGGKKRKIEEDFLIDPNEPVYCFCKKVAFGEMIQCEDDECEIEWFHYPCVNLTKTPKDRWVCSVCAAKRK